MPLPAPSGPYLLYASAVAPSALEFDWKSVPGEQRFVDLWHHVLSGLEPTSSSLPEGHLSIPASGGKILSLEMPIAAPWSQEAVDAGSEILLDPRGWSLRELGVAKTVVDMHPLGSSARIAETVLGEQAEQVSFDPIHWLDLPGRHSASHCSSFAGRAACSDCATDSRDAWPDHGHCCATLDGVADSGQGTGCVMEAVEASAV